MSDQQKILMIEDEVPTGGALKKKLENEGFEVLWARDGEAGLNMALKEKPKLILLDIILPKLDGMSVLDSLRADEWGKDVPIIILSNLGTAEEFEKGREKGVGDYLIKTDWSLEDVVKKIREHIS